MVFCSHGNSGTSVQQSLAQVLTDNGLRAISRGYSHLPLPDGVDLAVETDSSLRSQYQWQNVPYASIELKTKILNGIEEWDRIVPKALQICTDLGASVNYSTGHHVHFSFDEIDQDQKYIQRLLNLVYKFEAVIYSILAPSRRTCDYALPLTAEKVQRFVTCKTLNEYRSVLDAYDRRTGLNLTNCLNPSSSSHIEIRHHQGTLSPEKSRHWIVIWLQLLDHCLNRNCRMVEQLPNSRTSVEKFLICTGFKSNSGIYQQVDQDIRKAGDYILQRWKTFNGKVSLKQDKALSKEKEPSLFP
jgi:hypothetical protein